MAVPVWPGQSTQRKGGGSTTDPVCPLQLAHSTATRGAFLIQATTVLTPLISLAAGERLSRGIWSACGLALAGTALITADSAGGGSTAAASGVTLGKLAASPSLLVAAKVSFAMPAHSGCSSLRAGTDLHLCTSMFVRSSVTLCALILSLSPGACLHLLAVHKAAAQCAMRHLWHSCLIAAWCGQPI